MFRLKHFVAFGIIAFFVSCKTKSHPSRVELDDSIAVGFFKDSVLDGLVSFYDKKTGRLSMQCNYDSGVASGMFKKFYPNGQVWVEGRYVHGVRNGILYLYDENGSLLSSSYQHFEIPVGPHIKYSKASPKRFTFFSFDFHVLFDIDYDLLGNKGLPDVTSDMIFLTPFELASSNRIRYRLFLLHPPGYRFEYSLVSVDTIVDATKRLRLLEQKETPWIEFELDSSFKPANNIYGIQLDVEDSINGKNFRQFETIR